MGRFEIKKHTFLNNKNSVSTYISCSTDNVNPLEIEKDMENIIEFMNEKYEIKTTKLTFKEWLINKIKQK